MTIFPVITNYSSIGGTHLCGDADFEGKKYRFVIQDGVVVRLYIFTGKDYGNRDWSKLSTRVAKLIAAQAVPLLPEALYALGERKAKEEAEHAIARENAIKEHALTNAAPELLTCLKDALTWARGRAPTRLPSATKRLLPKPKEKYDPR